MGRKSALTPDQWLEVERRIVVDGESVYALAKEFGINESSIRRKIKPNKADKAERAEKHHPELRDLAVRKVKADEQSRMVAETIAGLPFAKQQIVQDLARRLSTVSHHVMGAAEYGAATAHRLSALANTEVAKIDDANPLQSVESLKGVAVLTKLANDSASIALNLLAANKEATKQFAEPEGAGIPLRIELVAPDVHGSA